MSRSRPKQQAVQNDPLLAAREKAQLHAAENASARALNLLWYSNYPGDNLSTARGWRIATFGLFHMLRDLQWDCGSLPADLEELRRVTQATKREWQEAWPLLAPYFPIGPDGRRRNPKLTEQRLEAIGKNWQGADAANIRHHPDWAYLGQSADEYLKLAAVGHAVGHAVASTDGYALQNQHQQEDAYQERVVIPEEVLRIVEGGVCSAGGDESEGGVWS